MMRNFLLPSLILTALLVVAYYMHERTAFSEKAQETGKALIGGPFELVDQHGKAVLDSDFRGKMMLVFFGFSNCPSICPVGLANMTQALEKLGNGAEKLAPIFITADPERDTPERLNEYMKNFHPSIIALTGTRGQVGAALKAYRVYAQKVETPGMDGYMIDHSSFIYLMDREGKYLTHFASNAEPKELEKKIREKFSQP